MSEFPRQGALTNKPWSLTRDTQFRTLLELLGNEGNLTGVLAGGGLVDNGGVSVVLLPGVYASKGVVLETTVNTTFNGLGSDATSGVWVRVVRTAATQTNPSLSDTFAIEVDDTTTGLPPAADAGWMLIGPVTTAAGDITALEYTPDVVAASAAFLGTQNIVRAHQSRIVPAGHQCVIYEEFANEGEFINAGDFRISGDV